MRHPFRASARPPRLRGCAAVAALWLPVHASRRRVLGGLAALLGAGGCVAEPAAMLPVPRPSAALMRPEVPPRCLFDETVAAGPSSPLAPAPAGEAANAAAGPAEPPAGSAVARRERERDCFRDAEHRVRGKLTRLQTSVRGTLQAIDAHNASLP